jgi:hypothetical protein
MSDVLEEVTVTHCLTEIFKAVADAHDGGKRLPADLRKTYELEMSRPVMVRFYERLVSARNAELGGSDV